MTNIAIIQGHPDGRGGHLCHALADAYAEGAAGAGHVVRRARLPSSTSLFYARENWTEGWHRLLTGRSARVVVTMGMPALVDRWWFRAHSLKSFERNILNFIGIKPVRECLFGLVEGVSDGKRRQWLESMRALGARAR